MKRGFTLIELLVVLGILGILGAILFPVFASARAKARQADCASNLRQLAQAGLMYHSDYDDWPTYQWAEGEYRDVDGAWMKVAKPPLPVCRSGARYGLNYFLTPAGLKEARSWPAKYKTGDASVTMMFTETELGPLIVNRPHVACRIHGAVNNVAFCDGHVKAIVATEYRKLGGDLPPELDLLYGSFWVGLAN